MKYKVQNPFPSTFTLSINIYPNCSIFPNDLPIDYPPKSLLLSSHPPNLSCSLKSVLPPLGNVSSMLLSLDQYYGIKYMNIVKNDPEDRRE